MPGTKQGLNPTVLVLAGCLSLTLAYLASGHARPDGDGSAGAEALAGLTLTGPFRHENLDVYLIHGPDKLAGETFLTLQEALASGQAVLSETGRVNELVIENLSGEAHVFVQSGDLVKGGRQDRLLAEDWLLPPKSGRVRLETFCVESGRWRQRAGERAEVFSGSEEQVAFRELKLAARMGGTQTGVWDEVARAQDKLAGSLGRSVRSTRSSTSLQLSLEDEGVRSAVAAYQERLGGLLESETDVVGLAVSINGRFNSSEHYASRALFRKLWPKLLRAAAVEAVAERPRWERERPPTAEAIMERLQAARSVQASRRALGADQSLDVRQGSRDVVFESRHALHGHRNMKDFAEVHTSVLAR